LPRHALTQDHPSFARALLDHASTEGDVQRDQVVRLHAPQLQQRLLCREQVALGVQYLEVVDYSFLVSRARELCDLPLRFSRTYLCLGLLREVASSSQGIRHLLKCCLDRALVACDRGILARLRHRQVPAPAAVVEDGKVDRGPEAPREAVLSQQVAQLSRCVAQASGEGDGGEECSSCRTDVRTGRPELLLRGDDVGPCDQQLRRKTRGECPVAELPGEGARLRKFTVYRSSHEYGQRVRGARSREAQRGELRL